jgi:HEAT repeat protein
MRASILVLALLPLVPAAAGPSDDAAIKELLASSMPEKREEAAAALGKAGDTAAAKKLIELLGDPDWGVRLAAIRGLGPIQFGPGRDALWELTMDGPIGAIRHAAARMLAEHDAKKSAERFERYIVKLKDQRRVRAIEALGVIGTEPGIAALSKQMRAPEPEHRAAAARALGRLADGEDALTGGLKDREDVVAVLAAIALAGIDSDGAREAVLDRLGRHEDLSETYLTRRIARRGTAANAAKFAEAVAARIAKEKKPGVYMQVGFFGELPGCAAAAREHLRHRDDLSRAVAFQLAGFGAEPLPEDDVAAGLTHRNRSVRYAAAAGAIRAAGETRFDLLRRLLADKSGDVCEVAVRYVVENRVKEMLPELSALAAGKAGDKKDWKVRVAACVAVGRVGYDADFSVLVDLAKAPQWWLRAAALEGLYHTYRKEAMPVLIAAFDDRHPVTRMTARRNLRYMTHQTFGKQAQFEEWWEKWKDGNELKHPEKELEQLAKYGYSTKEYQEVLRGTDIVAVKGRWDKVELVLEDLGVTHQAIRQQEIKDYGLSAKQIVLVNCEGSVDSVVTEYLQWMVCAGGYMATTDWSLVNATTKTFPGFVKGYVKQSTGNDVVVVETADPDNKRVAGVFRDGVELQWWLEIQAFPIAIEDPVRSTVLVDSLEMLTKYGSSAMMVEFPAGLGKVMHSTSHFYLQKEGFAHASSVEERKIFAADHLGLTIEEIRALDSKGVFGDINNTTPISKSYSMFHLLVNFIREKREIDLTR